VKENKIYIGGGFTEDQLLWIIPIVSNYTKNNSNKTIFFENKLSKSFINNMVIKKYLRNFTISSQNNLYNYKSKIIKYLIVILKYLPSIIFFVFFVDRKSILKNKRNWYDLQIFHSFWDTSLKSCNDGQLVPNSINKFIAIIRCYAALDLAKKIYQSGITLVFLGHTVYANTTLLAYLRKKNVKIFTQAAFNLHSQYKSRDNSWLNVSKKKLFHLKKKINLNQIIKYFNSRNIGKGNYLDSKTALKGKKNKIKLKNFNILFLHVFRDSPYNVIDKNRIFVDYYEWVIETLKIIKRSKQIWLIRLHPSHKRWGEDQLKTLKKIFEKVFHNNLPKNIILEQGLYSNLFLIKNSTKIVTFNGSVQLEAACFGKKSISIMSNLDEIDKDLNFCPKTYDKYKDLILLDEKKFKKISKIEKNKVINSKYVLFIRENIHYLKNDLNGYEIYRSDKSNIRNKNFKNIYRKLLRNDIFLEKNGYYLKKGGTHTIASKYLKYF